VEKAVVPFKEHKERSIQIQSVYITGLALLVGSCPHPLAFAFAMMVLAYFYMRDGKECRLAAIGIFVGSIINGIVTTYLYALGFTLFFLSIHVCSLWNKNIYRLMPYLCAGLSIPFGFYTFGFDQRVAIIGFLTFALMKLDISDLSWIRKDLVATSLVYGIVFISIALWITPMFQDPLLGWLICALLFMLAFFCEPFAVLAFVMYYLSASENVMIAPAVILAVFCVAFLKKEPWLLGMALLLIGFWFQIDEGYSALFALAACLGFLYDEKRLPFHIERHKEEKESGVAQSMLNKQIHNFASIFDSLSDYYEQVSDVESQMLSDMAKALKYSADLVKKVDTDQSQRQRILQALEGYQYEVGNLSMEDGEHGSLHIELDIRNIKKSEVTQTLLPLMEVLTHENLIVSEINHRRFTNGYYHITMENHVPFTIDAYADSQKNMYDASGDSFSIFRFRNTVISMISDGMGSGEHAAASSRLITNIFQRMVVSGIPKLDSIKCINKLLQSDAYATLDAICFDCAMSRAYIFKSAACPTFLIRDNNLYEINGSSLPVGIVSSIEPDCFVVDLKEGDEYLLISDGIFMDEIYEWLKIRDTASAKDSMESLMEILRKKQRLDDSTAVLSKIKKR